MFLERVYSFIYFSLWWFTQGQPLTCPQCICSIVPEQTTYFHFMGLISSESCLSLAPCYLGFSDQIAILVFLLYFCFQYSLKTWVKTVSNTHLVTWILSGLEIYLFHHFKLRLLSLLPLNSASPKDWSCEQNVDTPFAWSWSIHIRDLVPSEILWGPTSLPHSYQHSDLLSSFSSANRFLGFL
jgi:hypothetical protein